MMANSNYKLCWMHPQSCSRLNRSPCTHSTEIVGDNVPACHGGCQYYTRCKRNFEIGQFPNLFWNPPKNFRPAIEDYNALAITQQVRRNVTSFVNAGQNMIIYSNTHGNGKTLRAVTVASTLISEYAQKHVYDDNLVRYAYIPKIISDYSLYDKFSYENGSRQFFYEFVASLNSAKLVIWDDFGYGSDSYVENTIIRSIISQRINEGLSNIFVSTSNLAELSNCIQKKDWLRIKESSIIIEFNGPDMRNTEWGDTYG